MKIEFEDGKFIHLNIPLAFTSEKPWQTRLEDSLLLAMARRIQELEAEKEAFYMDYRTQCDKDTKMLEERIVILSRQLAEKETQRQHLMAAHQRQGDSAQEEITLLRQQISQCGIVPKDNQWLTFLELCALLPEDVCWGAMLTPALARQLLMAYRSRLHKDG